MINLLPDKKKDRMENHVPKLPNAAAMLFYGMLSTINDFPGHNLARI